MLRLPEDGRLAVDSRARVDQVGRVEEVAAVVALVASRVLVPADRARPLDVAVGQRVARLRRERAQGRLLDQAAVLPERPEDVARDACVVLRRRAREEVVARARGSGGPRGCARCRSRRPRGSSVPTARGDHDRRAVLVGAADHQHVVAAQAVVPGEDVRGHAEAGHMADVPRAARVRPCDGDEDPLCHALLSALDRSGHLRGVRLPLRVRAGREPAGAYALTSVRLRRATRGLARGCMAGRQLTLTRPDSRPAHGPRAAERRPTGHGVRTGTGRCRRRGRARPTSTVSAASAARPVTPRRFVTYDRDLLLGTAAAGASACATTAPAPGRSTCATDSGRPR